MLKRTVKKALNYLRQGGNNMNSNPTQLLALGKLLSNQQWEMKNSEFNAYEFKIFSQFGDDGLIQYLIKHIPIENHFFIEFGVENFLESNSRFLMMNNNWSGFVMDGSENNIQTLQAMPWYWKYDLSSKAAFITKENINLLLAETHQENIGILHIDLDGNDFHILMELNFSKLNPSILIVEYNAVFGPKRALTTPYKPDFSRTNHHYSNILYGASLSALTWAADQKGYSLIGCNEAGNNAYFLRNDLISEKFPTKMPEEVYKHAKFRESRNQDYELTLLNEKERIQLLKGSEVVNVIKGRTENL